MRAAVFMGPGVMEVREVATPKPKSGEVLVKVKSCAVCGTDVRIFTHGQKNVVPPITTGHEIAGVIEEIGKDVKGNFKKGDKVTVVTCVGCQKCRYCKKGIYNLCDDPKYIGYYYPGGFAEYVIIPEEAVKGNNIVKIDADISFPEISVIEPLTCCINGQEFLHIEKGDNVVIFGSGPIGFLHAELAKASGADKVIMADISQERLDMAKNFSITHFINSKTENPLEKVMSLTGGCGADVIIVACGVLSVFEQALQMINKRGRISYFASLPKDNPVIKFDANVLHYKEVSVHGAFASNRSHFDKAVELISSKKINVKKVVTHTFPLEKIVDAMNMSKSGVGLKSVILM